MTSTHAIVEPIKPHAGHTTFDRIVIVADDLTGACDSGVAFLASGRRARVVLDASHPDLDELQQAEPAGELAVWAFTTETRDATPTAASDRVTDCIAAIAKLNERHLLFKKVDSAARGHFGDEISAALRSSGAALALVAPAFPAAGRRVQDGVLNVRDWSGQDATTPLRDLFPQQDPSQIEELRSGPADDLERGILQALTNGMRILLCDANAQEDLNNLATAALRVPQSLLWVGSAGLAHALAGILSPSPARPVSQAVMRRGRTLLFAGSPHPITSLQLSHLEQTPSDAARSIHRLSCTNASQPDVAAQFTAEPVASLILTGGDTAAFVLRSVNASTIELSGEIDRGIPWGFIQGGLADGCIVVTKSGGFGERDALVRAFEFCEGRTRESA